MKIQDFQNRMTSGEFDDILAKIYKSQDIESQKSRYMAAVIKNVKIHRSPMKIRQRLFAVGIKPINTLVDLTNYVLVEMGQPMLLTPVESENKFIVWEMDDGFTDSVSLIWGVKNDQPYQPYVSGEFQHFNAAIVGYPNAYQIDYSQGEPVRIDYRFNFDLSTGQFIPEIDDWWME